MRVSPFHLVLSIQSEERPALPASMQNVSDTLANEVLVRVQQRIEVLRPTQGQHLEFPFSHQFLQITMDRTETDVGDMSAHITMRSWLVTRHPSTAKRGRTAVVARACCNGIGNEPKRRPWPLARPRPVAQGRSDRCS